MADLAEAFARLRGASTANVTPAAASPIEQFRTDFKTVWRTWRERGESSEQEMAAGFAEASAAVRANSHRPEWIACAQAHFRQMAESMERDRIRSERIRAEVRAAKEKTK